MLHRFIAYPFKLMKGTAVYAQTTSTSILGAVTDLSGAPVAGAEVTIDSVGRGLATNPQIPNRDLQFAPKYMF